MTGLSEFVFFAKYSVIPLNLPLKKDFLDTGPFIKPRQPFFSITSRALLKDFSIYKFEMDVIFFFGKCKFIVINIYKIYPLFT